MTVYELIMLVADVQRLGYVPWRALARHGHIAFVEQSSYRRN